MAQVFLREFFPPLPKYTSPAPLFHESTIHQLPMVPITEDEITRAVFSATPLKGPGPDTIPALVWQKLWPTVKNTVSRLFTALVECGIMPDQWKTARIIPLRKPQKEDYSVPGAYRPISLLSTLGKMLEAVMAQRLAYLSDTHSLLPYNHFGGLKQKSTIDALLVIQKKIYQAWRDKKVMSLITFDIKGAFSGVAVDVLTDRLRKRRIPEQMVQWIQNFCANRTATVTVNEEVSCKTGLDQAGLPQGSPLSPILYLFFNADLVQGVINKNKGSIAFIDDFTAWVTSSSIAENLHKIRTSVIPHLETWAHKSAAVFNSQKTVFIHFTRNISKAKSEEVLESLTILGATVAPSLLVKILGVILDQKLNYKAHIAQASKKGVNAALALKRLKNLRPKTARRLFQAKVVPVIDYASVIWSPGLSTGLIHQLNVPQKIAGQAIIGAFHTVASVIVESEAGLEPLFNTAP